MTDKVIPQDVEQFLIQQVDSIAHLEGLLMFHAEPQKLWNAPMLASVLFITETQAAVLLTRLREQEFILQENGFYRYQPRQAGAAALIDRLAELYRKCLVPITHLIHTKSRNRVQAFADAFRIRKD